MHSVNLLPPATAQKFECNRAIRLWSKLTVFCVLSSASAIVWGQLTVTEQERQISEERQALSGPRQVQQALEAERARLQELDEYELTQSLQRTQYSPLVIMELLQQVKTELHGKLEITSLEFVHHENQTWNDTAIPHGHVIIQAITEGTISSSFVMQQLRASEYFVDVQLTSALEKLEPSKQDLRFTVRCEF